MGLPQPAAEPVELALRRQLFPSYVKIYMGSQHVDLA